MLPQDFLFQLPRPTALLLLSSLVELTAAHVARQTPTTIPHRPLNVAPLPAPTSPPVALGLLNELLKRQDTNTICGYINGDPSIPATCSAGSHCVVDNDAGVVGCCPDGEDTCTSGVYTGCVDANNGAQTEVNPYVYTCTGSNVCYKNVFEGGFSQFGCGTASDLAATVSDGGAALSTIDVSLTQSPSSLATPTTLGTASSTPSSSTDSSSSGSSSSSESRTTLTIPSPSTATNSNNANTVSSTRSTSAATSSSTSDPEAPSAGGPSGSDSNRTGAIIGGSIGGVAALAGIVALLAFLLRRRKGNSRQGPGPRPGDTQYVSPMMGGAGKWAPLDQSPDGGATVGGKPITHVQGGRNTVWQYGDGPLGGSQDTQFMEVPHPGNSWGPGLGAAGAGAAGAAAYHGTYVSPRDGSGDDEIPLRHGSPEIDDFSRGFQDALSRIGEEDEEELSDEVHHGGNMSPNGTNGGGGGATGDLGDNSRPLWLQSRRQSRNLMWT